MKTLSLRHLLFLCIISFSIFFLSCSKVKSSGNKDQVATDEPTATQATQTAVSFCEEKIYPLCYKSSNLNLGYIKIKRGSDNNLYVTYRTEPTFYFMAINFFCGQPGDIPTLFSNFPYRKIYSSPFPSQDHTFIVPNMPLSFNIVAQAVVVKKAQNGNITGNIKSVWANGCNGITLCNSKGKDKQICGDLAGGSVVTYTDPANCFIQGPSIGVEANICSFPVATFFGIHPYYLKIFPWSMPSVIVGGYSYDESEGRLLSDSATFTQMPDAVYAFIRVATLKLSFTGFTLNPALSGAVQTIESFLSDKGKLSVGNIPQANSDVVAAAKFIDQFIETRKCPWRIE